MKMRCLFVAISLLHASFAARIYCDKTDFDANGGSGAFYLDVEADITIKSSSWIHVAKTGWPRHEFEVGKIYNDTTMREGRIDVSYAINGRRYDESVKITQRGILAFVDCTNKLAWSGGMFPISITTAEGAYWSATTCDWITLSEQTGHGSVVLQGFANPNPLGEKRTAMLKIAGVDVEVSQQGGVYRLVKECMR